MDFSYSDLQQVQDKGNDDIHVVDETGEGDQHLHKLRWTREKLNRDNEEIKAWGFVLYDSL